VIRDHHVRPDGTGYPNGLKGDTIHEFARFAAVADVYDAVTSQRVYSSALQPHVGVKVIRAGAGTQFCTNVVRHFRAVVMPYPVGHEVVLPDGRTGVVAAVDPLDPDRPTVRVPEGRSVEEGHGRHGRAAGRAGRRRAGAHGEAARLAPAQATPATWRCQTVCWGNGISIPASSRAALMRSRSSREIFHCADGVV
jgi:hypothetical protein